MKKFLVILPGKVIALLLRSYLIQKHYPAKPAPPIVIPAAPSYDDNSPCYVTRALADGSKIKAQIFCNTEERKIKNNLVIYAYDRGVDSLTSEGMAVSVFDRDSSTAKGNVITNLTQRKRLSVLGAIDLISKVSIDNLDGVRITSHKGDFVNEKMVFIESIKYYLIRPKNVIVLDYFLSSPDKYLRFFKRDLIEKAEFHFDLMASETKITS